MASLAAAATSRLCTCSQHISCVGVPRLPGKKIRKQLIYFAYVHLLNALVVPQDAFRTASDTRLGTSCYVLWALQLEVVGAFGARKRDDKPDDCDRV